MGNSESATTVAKSNDVEVRRLPTGEYLLVTTEEERSPDGVEVALVDMIVSLIRLKLPTSSIKDRS